MNGEAPSPPAAPQPQVGRGRKPRLPVTDKIAALRAELAAAEAEAREAEKAKAAIVGGVVIQAMRDNPDFAHQVVTLLRERIKGARDKAAIAELLL